MRVILYTGKGGVGKTSVAAATAYKIAEMGKKVLVMSTDQAHSLGDSFDKKLSGVPELICENLYAMEVDPVQESEKVWGTLKSYIKKILTIKTGESIETEELLVFPGLEELISLFKILEFSQMKEYDVILVDCAPTGETMSLLKFPGMLEEWITKFLPMERKMVKKVGPLIEKTIKLPMPDDTVFDDMERMIEKMNELKTVLMDKDIVSIRIVTTPEKIVVKEAKRNFTYLHLYDYNVDAIIVNKIYPKLSLSGYFSKWILNQEAALQDIEASFTGIPVFQMELLKHELRTKGSLQPAADMIYKDIDPSCVLAKSEIFTIDCKDSKYYFRITLPFADKQEFELLQRGEELSLSIKNQQRNFILPDKLRNLTVSGAKYENGMLNISFEQIR